MYNIWGSVQAENRIFRTPTFLDAFDLSIHMPGHFGPWDVVFTYHPGPLAPGSWPPRLDPPILTVTGCQPINLVRSGIFDWFSHIWYKILPRSQGTFQIQNSSPLQKVMLVWPNPIFLPLRGVSCDQPISPFRLGNGLGASFLAKFCIFFLGKPPDSVGALGSKIGHI